jgi:NADH-quinone oxidoreductase subunit M
LDLNSSLVTAVIFAPLLGALILAVIPGTERSQLKGATLLTMLVSFGLSLWMYLRFEVAGQPEFQLQDRHDWIPTLGIGYHVGIDGVSATLMLLTGFLGPIVVLAAWNNAGDRAKEFCIALLVLQTAMLGSFAALDVVLFYVFWEAVLIPMYLLIGIFGSENRIYASVKFFLFTMVGSMLMLVAILYLYLHPANGAARSFDFPAMLAAANALDGSTQMWLFIAFASAFAVKVPMWPLHTWLPDAHTEAPAAGSMVLAGVMLKMGTFGFMRYAMPLFPQAARQAAPWIGILAVIGIVYGSLMCLTQRDMKRLVAYSSVAHLGFVMLGLAALNPQASSGAVYQMVNHGISTGALFLLIGAIYERRHTRLIAEYGGLAKVAPVMAVAFLIITFSSIGLPGTNGFIGEFMILSGTFTQGVVSDGSIFEHLRLGWIWLAAFGTTGVILGAAYMLTLVQRVWFGPLRNPRNEGMPDLNLREGFAVVPLILAAVGMGIFPQPFLDRINPAAEVFSRRVAATQFAVQMPPQAPSRFVLPPNLRVRPAPAAEGAPQPR